MSNKNAMRGSFVNSAKEAAIIIFSILVAFSLDAWWESEKIDRDVQAILQVVSSEMIGNLESLDASIEHHRKISESITAMRRNVDVDSYTPEIFGTAVIDVEVYEPSSGAMDTLVSAGLLGEVDDTDLQLLLGTHTALLQDLHEKETRAVEFRDAARRRIASLGVRLWNAGDRAGVSKDITLNNLLLMRESEENAAISAAQTLQENIRKIITRLEETG